MSEDERQVPGHEKPAAPADRSAGTGESLPVSAARRGIKWDAVAAIIAACIGLLSLVVAGYTAYVQRRSANVLLQQTRAEVRPYLQVSASDFLPGKYVTGDTDGMVAGKGGRFMVVNKGVGPAKIKRVEVDVNGHPQSNWSGVLGLFGVRPDHMATSKFAGVVVAPGETLDVLVLRDKAWDAIKFRLLSGDTKLTIQACYCSTLDECWVSSTRYHDVKMNEHPVDSCHVIASEDEFEQY